MASCSHSPSRCRFPFADARAGFLHCVGLPFVDVLGEERISAAFKRHGGLFGRTYTTPIVLWAFLSQVLRDGKATPCQSAVARISSYLTGQGQPAIDPDTRDYYGSPRAVGATELPAMDVPGAV